ncbi:MAG: DUF3034 family protein [Oleibacter sp.]|nr:DUF3034 family protein [Thalassolituus sp.]
MKRSFFSLVWVIVIGQFALLSVHAEQSSGRLLATSGITQLEGSGGGGITPWAVISGHSLADSTSLSVSHTKVDVKDFGLRVDAISASYDNRIELSAAQHTFSLKGTAINLRQDIFGIKYRLAGDLIYTTMPQLALGIQHKSLIDGDVAQAVGARDNQKGTDIYIAASKLHLGALAGYHVLWNATLRGTKANQMGLLGFGGDSNSDYQWMPEFSLATVIHPQVAIGAEYRSKPDNLNAFKEDPYQDIFVAWFPSKQVNITLAYADLGSIAGSDSQRGLYASLTAYLR